MWVPLCFAASQLSAGFPVGQMSGQSAFLCAGVGGSEARAIALRKNACCGLPPPSGGRGRIRKPASTRVLHVPAWLSFAWETAPKKITAMRQWATEYVSANERK